MVDNMSLENGDFYDEHEDVVEEDLDQMITLKMIPWKLILMRSQM